MAKRRLEFSPETVQELARQFAAYYLGGCPMSGGAAVQDATRRVAAVHGRSFSELWALVHAAGYEIVNAESATPTGNR
jgi:hypothetical protein